MQCKDIPDVVVLEFLNRNPAQWHNWFWWDDMPNPDKSVYWVVPHDIPSKLLLAKMRVLIKRKLVGGCGCGCRGDFQITKNGQEYLEKFCLK